MEETQQQEETEYITRQEYIQCATEALYSLAEINPMTKDSQKTVNEIREKCLKIIGHYVNEMFDEIFLEQEP